MTGLLYSQPINLLSHFEGLSPSTLILVGHHIVCNECSTLFTVEVMRLQIEDQQQA